MSKVKKINIDSDISGQRLDNFLINKLKGVPKSKIYSIIRKGEIRVNSKRKKPSYKLLYGDEIRVPPLKITEKENNFIPSKIISFLKDSVIYENDDFIVLNKPEGIASHGGSGISVGVIEAVRNFGKFYRDSKLVHRLDKDTSGCQLIAKNNKFLRRCNELISQRKVKKIYHAVVYGKWAHKNGLYEINIKKNSLAGKERVVKVTKTGKIAKTFFKAINISSNFSYIECELITGRTHQLRVHLASMGHPIVGDKKYGNTNNKNLSNFNLKDRMYLHAYSFSADDLNIEFNVDTPTEFKKILKNDE